MKPVNPIGPPPSTSLVEANRNEQSQTAHPDLPPLTPEDFLDFVQALGSITSEAAGLNAFGQEVQKKLFEDIPNRYKDDRRALAYLDAAIGPVCSAVRAFSVERTAFKAARKQKEKLSEFRHKFLEPQLFASPAQGDMRKKASSILIKLLLPVGVLPILLKSTRENIWLYLAAAIASVLWLLFGDLLFTLATIKLRLWGFKSLGNEPSEVQATWAESIPRYKSISVDLLISLERNREKFYPNAKALIPGVVWNSLPPGEILEFMDKIHPDLSGRSPREVLSAIVDLHFSLDRTTKGRYLPPEERRLKSSASPQHLNINTPTV